MHCKNYAQARMSAIDVAATQHTCSAGCKRINALIEVDRAV